MDSRIMLFTGGQRLKVREGMEVSVCVCVFVCVYLCMLPLVVKVCPQMVHLYGLSPLCTSMCLSSDEAELRHFPQMLHEWSVAPVSALCCRETHKLHRTHCWQP